MNSITLITGGPGSGKSTVARLVARRFSKCAVINVAQLREMMVAGQCTPTHGSAGEGDRQFQRARSTAIYMARLYASQGVDVIIDDVCVPRKFADHYAALFAGAAVRRILLMPNRIVLRERLKQRAGPWDAILIDRVAGLYDYLEPMPKAGWAVLDSSTWTVAQTVQAVWREMGIDSVGEKRAAGE